MKRATFRLVVTIASECRPITAALSAAAVVLTSTGAALPEQPRYQFTPVPGATAIADNNTVLTTEGICRRGRCEEISLARYTYPTDVNSRGTVVGAFTDSDGGIPECPVFTTGFIRDPRGEVRAMGSSLFRITDNGVALGFASMGCIFGFYFILIDGEVRYLWDYDHQLHPLARPISINDAGVILAEDSYSGPRRYLLSDGESLTLIEPPDAAGAHEVRLQDLNNRGQMVGWWEEPLPNPPSYYYSHRYHGFLRQPDGDILPIDWPYDWPESFVSSDWSYGREEATLHLVETFGTQVFRITERGDVLVIVTAWYSGQTSSGGTAEEFREVRGIGSAHQRPAQPIASPSGPR